VDDVPRGMTSQGALYALFFRLTRNAGWFGVGIDHDTATFAVRTIGRWAQDII
jgi:hypothetical protein